MSDISIRRSHGMTLAKARRAAEEIAAELGEEFGLHHEWQGDVLHFKRMGLSGELSVAKRDVEIRVRLGFLLLPLRPRIEHEIHHYFDEHFGRETKARV
jgi:putative polyhydroxyalkanoate system protein